MRILVADDHPLVRDALVRLLAAEAAGWQVDEAADHDAVLALAARAPYALALLDLHMPGMDALAGLRRLRERQPALPLLVLSGMADAGTVRAVLEAGAAGFVPKSEPAAVLREAIEVVRGGGVFVPPHVLAAPAPAGAAAHLTPRQRDVLRLLLRGEPNRAIAARLGLAEGTVKLHIAAVLRALRARNRTEAVVRARAAGWLEE